MTFARSVQCESVSVSISFSLSLSVSGFLLLFCKRHSLPVRAGNFITSIVSLFVSSSPSFFCFLPFAFLQHPSDCPIAMLFIDFIASAALHQQPQTCSHFFVHSISRLLSIIYSIAYLQCLNGAAQAVSPQNPHYSTSRKNSGLHSQLN